MSVVVYGQSRQVGKTFGQQIMMHAGNTGSPKADIDREPQQKIRRAIKNNERKAPSQSGKHRGRKWLLSKQAQCAIYGHVHKQNGMACYYCGYEFE